MCGICGLVLERQVRYDPRQVVQRMADALRHRGPEEEGYLAAGPAFLGHRRLRIIDLAGGRQPIGNEDGSVSVVVNGEVYNYRELRQELVAAGHEFRTGSDSEVLVHLWEESGAGMLGRVNGMFALALWDGRTQTLFLARDRMGKKPLYWVQTGDGVVFASELKALMVHPGVGRRVSLPALWKYLLFDCVPAPWTILEKVQKLEPGTWLLCHAGSVRQGRYWDLTFPPADEEPPAFGEAAERLAALLKESVRARLVSDVPLGVLLSGGLDSSSVTALMCELSGGRNVQSFSVGFAAKSFDESRYAEMVAKHLGTQHHAQTLMPQTMMEILPSIVARLDEPLADNSLLPTYLLSKFTKEAVTVALGGDGGDELLLGYPTFAAHKVARWFAHLPRSVRGLTARAAASLPVSTDDLSLDYRAKRFVQGMDYSRFCRHFVWIGSIPPFELAGLLAPDAAPSDPLQVFEDVERHAGNCAARDDFDLLTYLYVKLYLCDDVLTKVDRASMMHALEVRAPFLDVKVVEFLAGLPTRYKLRGFTGKRLLRKGMGTRLPAAVLRRKKKGFGVPLAEWMKGELRPWVEELLSRQNLAQRGVFRAEAVERLWQEHLCGVRDNRKPLWSLVVLLLWMHENLG